MCGGPFTYTCTNCKACRSMLLLEPCVHATTATFIVEREPQFEQSLYKLFSDYYFVHPTAPDILCAEVKDNSVLNDTTQRCENWAKVDAKKRLKRLFNDEFGIRARTHRLCPNCISTNRKTTHRRAEKDLKVQRTCNTIPTKEDEKSLKGNSTWEEMKKVSHNVTVYNAFLKAGGRMEHKRIQPPDEQDKAVKERDKAVKEQEKAVKEREQAFKERDELKKQLDITEFNLDQKTKAHNELQKLQATEKTEVEKLKKKLQELEDNQNGNEKGAPEAANTKKDSKEEEPETSQKQYHKLNQEMYDTKMELNKMISKLSECISQLKMEKKLSGDLRQIIHKLEADIDFWGERADRLEQILKNMDTELKTERVRSHGLEESLKKGYEIRERNLIQAYEAKLRMK